MKQSFDNTKKKKLYFYFLPPSPEIYFITDAQRAGHLKVANTLLWHLMRQNEHSGFHQHHKEPKLIVSWRHSFGQDFLCSFAFLTGCAKKMVSISCTDNSSNTE